MFRFSTESKPEQLRERVEKILKDAGLDFQIRFDEFYFEIDLEKEEALTMLIKKYSGQFLEKGKEYIQNSKNKTRVFKIEVSHFTGKSNRQI